ncbi:MAG: hypothetical protein V1875_08715 [Candidatus Altiarchaeota archaeon]
MALDPICIALPLSILPIVFALATTLIFLKYPDKHISILLFSISFTLLLALFDLLTYPAVYFRLESLRYLFSSIAQGYAAMVGILGAFLIFYIETIKNKIVQIRKELIRRIADPDFSKIFSNDDEFLDYLRGWGEGHKRMESNYRAVQYSIVTLSSLMKEEQKIKLIISNQFLFLFVSIFFSLLILLPMDSFDVEAWPVKLIVYFVFSFSIASLMSSIYGVYRIIYPDKAV